MTLLRMLAFCAVDANDCRTPQTTSKTEARSASPARAALEVLNGVRSVDDQAAVQRQQDAERALKQDPFVKQLARDFGATLIPGSVQ